MCRIISSGFLIALVGLAGMVGGLTLTRYIVVSPPALPTPVPTQMTSVARIVSALGIDENGCAVGATTRFVDPTSIFIVAEYARIAAGTRSSLRLQVDNQPIEESVVLISDADYDQHCVYYDLHASDRGRLPAGIYRVRWFINEAPGPAIELKVE